MNTTGRLLTERTEHGISGNSIQTWLWSTVVKECHDSSILYLPPIVLPSSPPHCSLRFRFQLYWWLDHPFDHPKIQSDLVVLKPLCISSMARSVLLLFCGRLGRICSCVFWVSRDDDVWNTVDMVCRIAWVRSECNRYSRVLFANTWLNFAGIE